MNWTDNVVMRALGRLCDFMLLNILWVVCSIPLVTIGASTTALYTVMLKVVKNEEGYIVKGFLGAFKENFKKSTLIWLILAVLGIIIGIDSRVAAGMSSTMRTVFQSIFIIFSIVWLCVVIYVFPLTARYENSIRNTFKNALILSVAKLPYTLLMLVITAGPVILTFLNTSTLMIGIALWIVIGVSLVTWLNSYLMRKVFEIFHKDEEEN
ncbi:YesL family protein [Faecalicatena orotica]|uniref:Putative membrane protein YesL n=1 Tax=Faecalicatena orotica TaxID=1544 RepID=A0A2Y9B9X2_9FIRM|nr:DUF624 domain-containing protein [Faecalicatena orotica]PWJ31464.1 putative membrane protein YesL [Faecalicatena orotica]SSA54671.1 Uncharacterized membrane protein YesL [Faecalicatena orotica]